jgi:hypothetical protein
VASDTLLGNGSIFVFRGHVCWAVVSRLQDASGKNPDNSAITRAHFRALDLASFYCIDSSAESAKHQ